MKLILQECWFKWSLNQHHKNKKLPVQAASHTKLSRHFNLFGQRKQRRPQGSKTENICLVAEVDYNIWLCKPFNLHISSKESIFSVENRENRLKWKAVIRYGNPWKGTSCKEKKKIQSVYISRLTCLGWKDLQPSEQQTHLSPQWARRSAALWFQEALPPDWKHPDLWTLAGAGETKASLVNSETAAQRKYDWKKVEGTGPCYY